VKFYFLFFILLLFRTDSNGQEFSKGINSITSPFFVNLNYFIPVKIESNGIEFSFDKENPYTNILLVNNQNQESFQILYQTNIWGDLSYLALSNNLYSYFDCPQKLDLSFFTCIKKARSSVLKSNIIDEQINCVIERLNQCN